MRYREAPPRTVLLRPFVRCLWELSGPAGSALERIVPDGCAEIVLNGGAPFLRLPSGGGTGAGAPARPRAQAEVLVVGQVAEPFEIAPSGAVELLGVRFEPSGLHALLGVPMHELSGRDLCLGQLDEVLRAELRGALALPRARRAGAVEALLARRLAGAAGPGLAAAAVARLERGLRAGAPAGLLSVAALAAALGTSPRALERTFRREVGLAPRTYRRVRRLQGVLAELERGLAPVGSRGSLRSPPPPRSSGSSESQAALAARHGYADQAHLVREFRRLAGTTPGRYAAERTPMGSALVGAGGR